MRKSSIITILAIGAVLAIIMLSSFWSSNQEYPPSHDVPRTGSPPTTDVVFQLDEQGRSTVFLGDVKLLIDHKAMGYGPGFSTTPRDMFQFNICWPNANEIKGCNDIHDQIRVILRASPISRDDHANPQDYRRLNALESLARSTQFHDGPFDMNGGSISEYKSDMGGDAALYVILKERRSGRYPIARCSWLYCRVDFSDRPGIRVLYRFHRDHIVQFAEIDQAVRRQIEAFEPSLASN